MELFIKDQKLKEVANNYRILHWISIYNTKIPFYNMRPLSRFSKDAVIETASCVDGQSVSVCHMQLYRSCCYTQNPVFNLPIQIIKSIMSN